MASDLPCAPHANDDGFTNNGARNTTIDTRPQCSAKEVTSQALLRFVSGLGKLNILVIPAASVSRVGRSGARASETPTVQIPVPLSTPCDSCSQSCVPAQFPLPLDDIAR